ncbi:NAD-dependent epimerase/dehydratase family protein [Acidovorax sp. LjRoot194]|uniref:NAD-dependent epimerase/dehydratase family protein n=1 Tax=Acidovorax sp. LjRoot194 TaxID=3342280 RepID=UPI003ED0A938
MKSDCIVLTGAAGRLGASLRESLSEQCAELRLVDKTQTEPVRPNETVWKMDLGDRARLREAMSGCTAVVHFAGFPREAAWGVLLPANIMGVINLWEIAHEAGVERIIYASSNHAVGLYPRTRIIGEKVHPLPDSRYGLTKVFMEGLAELYATKFGLRGFGLRIGHCAPEPSDARMLSHWIHPDDLAALVTVGLNADYESEIVYGVSGNPRSWWKNQRAAELGYQPRHSAEAFAPTVSDRTSGDPIEEHFQGGAFAAKEFENPRFRLP